MRITLGPSVVRGNINESITGLWSFANALGLLTDVIGERTAAAGVTVDGLLIQDAGIPEAAVTAHEAALAILEAQIVDGTILARLAAAETITGIWLFEARVDMEGVVSWNELALATTVALRARVTGDNTHRWIVNADGLMEWGPGNTTRDTNLFRAAADLLHTDDAFQVGGTLRSLADLEWSVRDMTLSGGATDHDVATGTVTVQLLDPNGTTAVGGFAGGTNGRVLVLFNTTGSALTISHQNGGSVAANRIICPSASNFNISGSDGVLFWYDGPASRWRTLALNP